MIKSNNEIRHYKGITYSYLNTINNKTETFAKFIDTLLKIPEREECLIYKNLQENKYDYKLTKKIAEKSNIKIDCYGVAICNGKTFEQAINKFLIN